MRKIRRIVAGQSAIIFGSILIAVGGCDMPLPDDQLAEGGAARPVEDFVTIAFRNLATDDAVTVEFYTTTGLVGELPDGLFIEENLVTKNIGVAGTGLLVPESTDVLEISCNSNLVIGTAGGVFLDNETGEVIGRGEPRWLDATSTGLCGAIVGFTFDVNGDSFITTVEIRR